MKCLHRGFFGVSAAILCAACMLCGCGEEKKLPVRGGMPAFSDPIEAAAPTSADADKTTTGEILTTAPQTTARITTATTTRAKTTATANKTTAKTRTTAKAVTTKKTTTTTTTTKSTVKPTTKTTARSTTAPPVKEQTGTGITILSEPGRGVRNEYVSLTIQGKPNTAYTLRVQYKSGWSQADGMGTQTSDARGRVTWTWKIGGRTSPGTWPVEISGDGQRVTTSLTVVS